MANAKKPKRRRAARKARARGGRAEAPAPEPPPESELLDMNQAAERLKTSRATFYRWLRAGKIKGMKLGRLWRFRREDVERFLEGKEPRVDLPADLSPLIATLRRRVEELGARDVAPEDADDVTHAVSLMIRLAVALGASDLHLAPHMKDPAGEAVGILSYRIDGALHLAAEVDVRLLPALVERWVRMAACDMREKVRPQDGRILVRLNDLDRAIDLRVNFLPVALGPSLTARVLDPDVMRPFDLGRLGFGARDREKLLRALDAPWGAILVVGPTGCGKTTTLYACLSHLSGPDRKIMTAEEPIEFFLPWVIQMELRPRSGVTFPVAVRAFLRSAPNVILVGEIRERETLGLVHAAALTGHLVFSTLHADGAAKALTRMVEMGADPFVIADSTRLVVAQRLIRKLCTACSQPHEPPASRLARAAELCRAGGVDWDALPKTFRGPRGCALCGHTGFKGREVVAEALEVTPGIGEALRRGATVDELCTIAVGQGMTTLAADGIRRAASGATSLDEALRVLRGL